jgi:hypothetical protein
MTIQQSSLSRKAPLKPLPVSVGLRCIALGGRHSVALITAPVCQRVAWYSCHSQWPQEVQHG